jgi:hypothetical protein
MKKPIVLTLALTFVLLASNPQKVYARKLYWKNGRDTHGLQRYVLSKRRNTYVRQRYVPSKNYRPKTLTKITIKRR